MFGWVCLLNITDNFSLQDPQRRFLQCVVVGLIASFQENFYYQDKSRISKSHLIVWQIRDYVRWNINSDSILNLFLFQTTIISYQLTSPAHFISCIMSSYQAAFVDQDITFQNNKFWKVNIIAHCAFRTSKYWTFIYIYFSDKYIIRFMVCYTRAHRSLWSKQ